MSKNTSISTDDIQNEYSEILFEKDTTTIIKITNNIIGEVRAGNLHNAVKILKELSINTKTDIDVSEIPLVEDKPYHKSVFHILQEEGLTTEANAFGSHCQALGYIDEFYYDF